MSRRRRGYKTKKSRRGGKKTSRRRHQIKSYGGMRGGIRL